MQTHKHVYLAAPYRGTPQEIAERMRVVAAFARYIRQQNHFMSSPLLQHWTFDPAVADVTDNEYWLDLSEITLRGMRAVQEDVELWLLVLPGWSESRGIARELAVSADLGLLVRYFDVTVHDGVYSWHPLQVVSGLGPVHVVEDGTNTSYVRPEVLRAGIPRGERT